jgi:hypothetical protein
VLILIMVAQKTETSTPFPRASCGGGRPPNATAAATPGAAAGANALDDESPVVTAPGTSAYRGRSVALLFHGHFMRTDAKRGGCSDFFASACNIRAHVFAPLLRARAQLRVFVHSFKSDCAAADAALLAMLQPEAYELTDGRYERIVHSFQRVLQLAIRHTHPRQRGPPTPRECAYVDPARAAEVRGSPFGAAEFGAALNASASSKAVPKLSANEALFILLRPDMHNFEPLPQLAVDLRTVSYAWRTPDYYTTEREYATVTDHLFILPARWASTMLCALHFSGLRYRTGSAHYVVRSLREPLSCAGLSPAALLPNVTFRADRTVDTLADKRRVVGSDAAGAFVAINRNCAGPGCTCATADLGRFARPVGFMRSAADDRPCPVNISFNHDDGS